MSRPYAFFSEYPVKIVRYGFQWGLLRRSVVSTSCFPYTLYFTYNFAIFLEMYCMSNLASVVPGRPSSLALAVRIKYAEVIFLTGMEMLFNCI